MVFAKFCSFASPIHPCSKHKSTKTTHLKIATIEYNLLDRYIVTKSSVNNLGIRTGPEETNTFNTFAKGRHVILLDWHLSLLLTCANKKA
jgi:hypothetical protein